MEAKKKLLTYAGLKALEDELEHLKVVKRKEVAGKIKEAREQGDLSENAEYDAAKDEQRDIEARIEELEGILKITISYRDMIFINIFVSITNIRFIIRPISTNRETFTISLLYPNGKVMSIILILKYSRCVTVQPSGFTVTTLPTTCLS